ncbi:MAG: MafI family immunity protein [Arachnia propionica]|uniref:MafI family immunity protein n=1 Tax=Arachnia propionica TaxID=1750 RepID=UPI00270B76D1|nr:MafI family immunity protein [Arachnia propionica]
MNFSTFRRTAAMVRALDEMVDQLSSRLSSDSVVTVRDLLQHGEEGLGLEFLLEFLYDQEITPSPEEKHELNRLGHFFEIQKHQLCFWPDPPPNRDDHGGNDDPPRLLDGELEPLTYTIGFLRAPLEQVLHAFPRYRRGFFNRRVRTLSTGGLRDHLLALEPLHASGEAPVLITATTTPEWTAVFDGAVEGTGVVTTAVGLVRRLDVAGFVVRSIPPRSSPRVSHGERHFFVLDPQAPRGVARRVAVIESSTRSWVFDHHGEPQPFEDTARYNHPHQDERFTNDMLRSCAESFGVDPWNDDFYRPPGYVIPADSQATLGRTLVEVRRELGLGEEPDARAALHGRLASRLRSMTGY